MQIITEVFTTASSLTIPFAVSNAAGQAIPGVFATPGPGEPGSAQWSSSETLKLTPDPFNKGRTVLVEPVTPPAPGAPVNGTVLCNVSIQLDTHGGPFVPEQSQTVITFYSPNDPVGLVSAPQAGPDTVVRTTVKP